MPQDVQSSVGSTFFVLICCFPVSIELTVTSVHHLNSCFLHQILKLIFLLKFQEDYKLAVQTILHSQPDPVVAERLATAFTNLTESIELDNRAELRGNRYLFRDNFEKFCWNIHGFLNIK